MAESIANKVWIISFAIVLFASVIAQLGYSFVFVKQGVCVNNNKIDESCAGLWTLFYLSTALMLISACLIVYGFYPQGIYSNQMKTIELKSGFFLLFLSIIGYLCDLYFSTTSVKIKDNNSTIITSVIISIIVLFMIINPWLFNRIYKVVAKSS